MTSTFITIDIFGKLRMYEYSDGKDDNDNDVYVNGEDACGDVNAAEDDEDDCGDVNAAEDDDE